MLFWAYLDPNVTDSALLHFCNCFFISYLDSYRTITFLVTPGEGEWGVSPLVIIGRLWMVSLGSWSSRFAGLAVVME